MDLMSLLQGQLTDNTVSDLSKQTGINDPKQTKKAANQVLSALIGAMSKNASNEQGANALAGALERDHDGSILDNLSGLFGSNNQPTLPTSPFAVNKNTNNNLSERSANGMGILKHVLGGNQGGMVQKLSGMLGMNQGSTLSLMASLAPMLMGTLGKAKQQQNLNPGGLASLLNNQHQQNAKQNSQLGGLMGLLDSDGDGNVIDDIGGMLGGLFGK
ncbi:MAG: DUF937 domain-containing protein [Aureispira sp.]|nr:DUF937 domain-containing protein [Aureispira sp.]